MHVCEPPVRPDVGSAGQAGRVLQGRALLFRSKCPLPLLQGSCVSCVHRVDATRGHPSHRLCALAREAQRPGPWRDLRVSRAWLSVHGHPCSARGRSPRAPYLLSIRPVLARQAGGALEERGGGTPLAPLLLPSEQWGGKHPTPARLSAHLPPFGSKLALHGRKRGQLALLTHHRRHCLRGPSLPLDKTRGQSGPRRLLAT